MNQTIQNRIINFLDNNPRWFRKAELIEIAVKKGLNGDTVGRESRRAEEAGLIQKRDYKQKNGEIGTEYASLKVERPKEPQLKIITRDGARIAIYE